MLAGVTIVDPAATVIDVGVEIGAGHGDRAVHESARRHQRSARGSTIGPRSHADRRPVGDGATVVHSYVNGRTSATASASGRSPICGPGTVLREGSKAGTFVEIKNSDVGARQQGAAPVLHRRRRHRRGHEPRRRRRSPPTTTATASTARRSARGSRPASTRPWSHRSTVGDDAFTAAGSVIGHGRSAGCARRVARRRASATSRGTPSGREREAPAKAAARRARSEHSRARRNISSAPRA